MKKLFNKSQANSQIAIELAIAESFISRLQGLMFTRSLPMGSALWIRKCKSIHTFFMNFAIDVIFIDKNLVVKRVYRNLAPWHMTKIIWQADSVIELSAGTLSSVRVDIGDELYVGD